MEENRDKVGLTDVIKFIYDYYRPTPSMNRKNLCQIQPNVKMLKLKVKRYSYTSHLRATRRKGKGDHR